MKQMKGQVDLIFGMSMFFVVIIAMIIVSYVFLNGIFGNANFQQSVTAVSPTANTIVTHATTFFNGVDNFVALLYFIFGLAAIIAAAFSDSHLIVAVVVIMLLPIELTMALIYHDAFFSIIQGSIFAGFVSTIPSILVVFQYYPLITFIMAIILLITTFSKGG